MKQLRPDMRRFNLLIIITIILPFAFCSGQRRDKKIIDPQEPVRNGVALIITGAAARIPQEAALLEELDKRGLLKNLVFISGVSSGSLNAVMLNGILSGKMTWDEYRNILFSITNNDVFIQKEKKKIPVDTSPLRELLTRIVEKKLGYSKIGDLPFTTEISVTHVKDLDLKKTVYRLCSRKINEETDTTLSLVDIMMASTAFPIAFPRVRIRNTTTIPDAEYIDGAAGDDYIPYHALPEFEQFRGTGVEKVYIISRKTDSIPEISEELKDLGINDKGVFDKLGISLDEIMLKEMEKKLEIYSAESPELAANTYIWMPEFKASFPLFNFDDLKRQFDMTSQWAKTHDPVPLSEFLLQHMKK
jgi:predicted acylesterase/phospholipase RssA